MWGFWKQKKSYGSNRESEATFLQLPAHEEIEMSLSVWQKNH